MTIEALGSIGELVAAIATIATLFYLAMQIRHSSEATRGASQQALIDTSYDASWEMGRDADHAWVFGAGMLDFDALSDRDKTMFSLTVQRYFGNLEKGLRLREAGLIDQDTVDSVGMGCVAVITSPGGAKWWQGYRMVVAPIVAEYLDQRLEDGDENAKTWDELWPYWARWVAEDRGKGGPTA